MLVGNAQEDARAKVGSLSVHGGRQSVSNDSRNQRPGRTHSEHMMVPAGGGLSGRSVARVGSRVVGVLGGRQNVSDDHRK